MKTTEIPNRKLIVRVWPNNAADAMPVNIVATVEEYFFKIVSAYLKKKEDRIPCAALFNIRSMVALECPSKISKLLGPVTMVVPRMAKKLNMAPYPYKNKF
jgi:hypothetical protein